MSAVSTRARRPGTRKVLLTGLALLITGFLLFPLYWMLNASLQPGSALFSRSPSWFPTSPDFGGYEEALATQLGNLSSSLLIACCVTALALILAVPAAYGLAKLHLPGITSVMFLMLFVQMLPAVVMVNGLYALFNQMGLLESYLGLIIADTTLSLPFAVLLLRSFIESVPDSITEAARVDGAGPLRTLWSIVVPASRNGIVTAGVFTFLFAWSDFLFALTLTSSGTITPITLGIYRYIGTNTTDWNSVMATAILASIPPAVLLVVAQRHIAAGATAGAVKD